MFSRFQHCENGYQKTTEQFREMAGYGSFIHQLTFHLMGKRIINYFKHLGFEKVAESTSRNIGSANRNMEPGFSWAGEYQFAPLKVYLKEY